MTNTQYQVLLYYKYINIDDPEKLKNKQRELCSKLNLKGRIIIAREGINGTLEGTLEDTEKYISELTSDLRFKDINFKKSVGTGNAFPKLSIKVRPEIVAARLVDVDPNKVSGKYINADELHEWFKYGKEFYTVDMRNDYEYISGYFENSIFSGLHNFYDLPSVLPKLEKLKDKTIVTVCTGGVRCEKASGYLVLNGFKNVYQLKDGIQTYMEKYPNSYFKGKLYVFDNRLTVGFNTSDSKHEIVGKCFHCNKPCDDYVNCEYDICHYHYICCKNCRDLETGLAFCKKECKENYLKFQYKTSTV
jgi:UPF0176 protein